MATNSKDALDSLIDHETMVGAPGKTFRRARLFAGRDFNCGPWDRKDNCLTAERFGILYNPHIICLWLVKLLLTYL